MAVVRHRAGSGDRRLRAWLWPLRACGPARRLAGRHGGRLGHQLHLAPWHWVDPAGAAAVPRRPAADAPLAAAGLLLVAAPVADTISPFGFSSNRLIELLTTWPLYVAIGIAILRYRLYDIDRLLNRTLVYGLLTMVLGLAYSLAVLVGGQLSGRVGGQPPSWAVAGATLAMAALFQPALRRIQTTVDRRFTAAAKTPPPPSRRSPAACASSWTWTR